MVCSTIMRCCRSVLLLFGLLALLPACRQIAGYATTSLEAGAAPEAGPDLGLDAAGDAADGAVDGIGRERGLVDASPPPPLAWALAPRHESALEIVGVAFDEGGALWVAGTLAGRVRFAGQTLQATGKHAAVLVRFPATATTLTASDVLVISAPGADLRLTGLALRKAKGLVLSGLIRGTVTIAGQTISAPTNDTAFVVRVDASNFPSSLVQGGLTTCITNGAPAQITALATDEDGGIYVSGEVEHAAATCFNGIAGRRAFVAAYDPDGNGNLLPRWWLLFGSDTGKAQTATTANALALGTNDVYVVGSFAGTAALTRDTGGSDFFSAQSGLDGYVARIPRTTPTGWELMPLAGSTSIATVRPTAVAYDESSGRLYVAGRYGGGNLVINGTNVAATGYDVFLLALADIPTSPFFTAKGTWSALGKDTEPVQLAVGGQGRLSLAGHLDGASLGSAAVPQPVLRLEFDYDATSQGFSSRTLLPLGGSGTPTIHALAVQGDAVALAGAIDGDASLANTKPSDRSAAFLVKDNSTSDNVPADWAAFGVNQTSVSVLCGAADAQGNLYLGGRFQGAVDFDANGKSSLGQRASRATFDAFVASYDANGVFRWVRTLHSDNPTAVKALVDDGTSDLFAAGFYLGGATLDDDAALPAAPSTDTFVLRLDRSTGAQRWTARYDTPSVPGGPTTDDVVAATYHVATKRLTLVGASTDGGHANIALVSFTPNLGQLGPVSKRQSWGGDQQDRPTAAALLADGAVVVGGYVTSTSTPNIALGDGTLYKGSGGQDAFVGVYEPDTLLARRVHLYGSADDEQIVDVATQGQRVALAGHHVGSLNVGGLVLGAATGDQRGFVALLDASGDAQWARAIVGSSAPIDELRVAFDQPGEVYLAVTVEGSPTIAGEKITLGQPAIWIGALGSLTGIRRWTAGVLSTGPRPALALADLWLANGPTSQQLLVAGSFGPSLAPADGPLLVRDGVVGGLLAAFH